VNWGCPVMVLWEIGGHCDVGIVRLTPHLQQWCHVHLITEDFLVGLLVGSCLGLSLEKCNHLEQGEKLCHSHLCKLNSG